MNDNTPRVSLSKAVYALKCPVCGAACRSKEDGNCPYCGAYLDFADPAAPPQSGGTIPMQTYDAPPIQPYQQQFMYGQPQFAISAEEAQRKLRSWQKGRLTAYLIYCVIAAVSIFGVSALNEGDFLFDLVMWICVLGYLPLSFFLPICVSASRPDDCIYALNMPKPLHKVLSWLLYTIAEFGLMFALTVIAFMIGL